MLAAQAGSAMFHKRGFSSVGIRCGFAALYSEFTFLKGRSKFKAERKYMIEDVPFSSLRPGDFFISVNTKRAFGGVKVCEFLLARRRGGSVGHNTVILCDHIGNRATDAGMFTRMMPYEIVRTDTERRMSPFDLMKADVEARLNQPSAE